jgi:hypothetical protein
MIRSILLAAAAATAISLSSFAAPAQAMTADPGLGAKAPSTTQLSARWHNHHYSHYHGWRHSYAYSPYYHHRHCWSVRTWHGWARRCSW